MKPKILIATLAVALVAVVAASTSVATPDPGLKIAPMAQLQFGTVPIGDMLIKSVDVLNRTNEWMDYGSANWPGQTGYWPTGIWNVDPQDPSNTTPFNCWTIAPKSSCTLYFEFTPYEAGLFTDQFQINYVGETSGDTYNSQTIEMMGTGF